MGESWFMRTLSWMFDFCLILTCRGNESISDCCVSTVSLELQTTISKITKTKENKSALATIQKMLKRVNPAEEHM